MTWNARIALFGWSGRPWNGVTATSSGHVQMWTSCNQETMQKIAQVILMLTFLLHSMAFSWSNFHQNG